MALLEIKVFGGAVLRKKAASVAAVTDEVRQLVDDMFETMYEADGIGLAAPQVGVTQRIIVIDAGPNDPSAEAMALINPEIVWSAGEVVGEEGCLSLPEINGDVKRAAHIRVQSLDRDGAPGEIEATGITARVIQHEMDHLDGILMIDHFSTIKRNLLRGQLRRLKRESKRQPQALTYAADTAAKAGG